MMRRTAMCGSAILGLSLLTGVAGFSVAPGLRPASLSSRAVSAKSATAVFTGRTLRSAVRPLLLSEPCPAPPLQAHGDAYAPAFQS